MNPTSFNEWLKLHNLVIVRSDTSLSAILGFNIINTYEESKLLLSFIDKQYLASIASYVFIMLNPSIADKEVSDLTITKLCNFSHSLNEVGFIHIVNLYPFYETNSVASYRLLFSF